MRFQIIKRAPLTTWKAIRVFYGASFLTPDIRDTAFSDSFCGEHIQ